MIKKEVKDSLRIVGVLVVVGIASGLILAGIYKYAQPKIELHREENKQRAIYSVLGEVNRIKIIRDKEGEIYQGLNKKGEGIGYAFSAKGGGYQGEIILMVGLSADLSKILGIEVVENLETPGLGGKITGEDFKGQFKGLRTSRLGKVKAIMGATISSESVLKIVKKRIAEVKKRLKQIKE